MNSLDENRRFMKSNFDSNQPAVASDQMNGVPAPPIQKSPLVGSSIIDLPKDNSEVIKNNDLYSALINRRSIRQFSGEPMAIVELSFLLETTARIQNVIGGNVASLRPVPSGGARHAFETYLAVLSVDGLEEGIYHYLPITHQLERISEGNLSTESVLATVNGQKFAASSNVVFYWSAIPYRAEWRYGLRSHKVMLIDVGHIGQNLYLACEAIGAGTCAIASYDQQLSNDLLQLDGTNEFVVYISPVGKR